MLICVCLVLAICISLQKKNITKGVVSFIRMAWNPNSLYLMRRNDNIQTTHLSI